MHGFDFFSSRNSDESTKDSTVVGMEIGRITIKNFDELPKDEQYEFALKIDYPVRKTAHATEYMILSICLFGTFADAKIRKKILSQMLAWGTATLYAATDEIHQLFVGGRAGRVKDVMIDSSGALTGMLIIGIIVLIINKSKNKKNEEELYMNSFHLPCHLIVQSGIFDRIPEVMEDEIHGLIRKKTLLVTEKNLNDIFSSRIEKIRSEFNKCDLYLIENASYDNAVALAKKITMDDIETVIGFGGGTVLDLAKFAAFVSKATLISLPTTLSNDSLASPVAVLGTTGKARKTFRCTIPDAILVDADVIMSAPPRQLLSGIGDTVSKYTALNDWKIAYQRGKSKVNDFAYMISKMAFNSICYNNQTELMSVDFIKRLTQDLVMGGLAMEIAGSSRPSSGSEHLFCHALEENFSEQVSVPHGIAVAIGSYGAVKFQKRNVEKIKNVIDMYHLPVKPSSWNITKEIFIGAWQTASATRIDRYTILNETELSEEMLGKLYDEMEEFAWHI